MSLIERCALALALELGYVSDEREWIEDELNEHDRKRAMRMAEIVLDTANCRGAVKERDEWRRIRPAGADWLDRLAEFLAKEDRFTTDVTIPDGASTVDGLRVAADELEGAVSALELIAGAKPDTTQHGRAGQFAGAQGIARDALAKLKRGGTRRMSDWQRDVWQRMKDNDRRKFDATGKAVVSGETDAEHRERILKAAMNAGCDEAERLGYGSALGYVEAAAIAEKAASVAIVDPMRESRIARARGLAMAIAECRDDARLDGIREGAAEIVSLLGEG